MKITQDMAKEWRTSIREPNKHFGHVIQGVLLELIDALVDKPEERVCECPECEAMRSGESSGQGSISHTDRDESRRHNVHPEEENNGCRSNCASQGQDSVCRTCPFYMMLPGYPEPQPEPTPWVKGDYAWNGRTLVRIGQDAEFPWMGISEYNANHECKNLLHVPTTDQLRTLIGTDESGKEIYAWAWKIEGNAKRVNVAVLWPGYEKNFNAGEENAMIGIIWVKAAGIPILTAGQVEKHFKKDGYPGRIE